MKKTTKLVLLSMILLLTNQSYATKWRVNSNPSINANFTSLQAANNSSSVAAGDTLYCENGSYFGDVTLNKRLVIIGPGYFLAQNDSTQAYPTPSIINNLKFTDGSSNTLVTGMKIIATCTFGKVQYDSIRNISLVRNQIHTISYYSGSSVSFENIVIRQCYITNLINLDSRTKSVYIQNNIIVGYVNMSPVTGEFSNNTLITNYGSYGFGASNTTIFNNIIINNYSSTSQSYRGISINTFTPSNNNTISHNVIDNTTIATAPNNYFSAVDTNVVDYTGSSDSQYQLKVGSPAIAYGFNNNDCGAFGGTYAYILSGLPYMIPHIFDAIIPGSANKTDGLNVIIKAKVQNQ